MKWTAHTKNTNNSRVNIICFPYAGGSASYFAPWGRKLPEGFGLVPVLYPMRELRSEEKMYRTAEEFAEAFVSQSKELFLKPFVIFGHCTGSLIAYEVICRLKKELGVSPEFFVSSAEPSPRYTRINSAVLSMSDGEFIDYTVGLGLIDKDLAENKDFMDYYLPPFKSDFCLHQRYAPKGKETDLDCPIIALRGVEDAMSVESELRDWENYTEDFSFHSFSGGHFFIDKYSSEIIELISAKYNLMHR